MSAIEDITDTEFDKVLEQVRLGERDIVHSRIDERQHVRGAVGRCLGSSG